MKTTLAIDASKFWSRLDTTDPNKCWEWPKCRTKAGYGRICIKDVFIYSHRTAWELANGKSAEGFSICHKCDNPPCCNPAHLFLGTHKDNMQDMHNKGRFKANPRHGTKHKLSKLTEQDVIDIKRRYKRGDVVRAKNPNGTKAIAKDYGVAYSLIHRIITGQSWPHVKVPQESHNIH